MFSFLTKKKKSVNQEKSEIVAPVSGVIKAITASCDTVFAEKMVGDGFLITPASNDIVSPIDGVITMIFPTFHALGLKDHKGHEYLIHIGVDTVSLKGMGFTCFVAAGDVVTKNTKLLHVDFAGIKDKVPSTDVIVVLTDKRKCTVLNEEKTVVAGEENIVSII